ncbi:MAG: tetratricopeptide repeat protein [Ignavibacteria bacterium]|nr:tetratricopeptide repeat protein [Ignavibacteria bacterium]
MKKIFVFIILVLITDSAFSQATFVIKLYDFAWSVSYENNENPKYVGILLIMNVINEGNQSDVCYELEDIYLDCSNKYYTFGTDIVLSESYGADNIILPYDTSKVMLFYLVPKDADALTLRFKNAPEAGGKYITESFNKWKNTNRSKLTYFENQAADYFSKKNYTMSIVYCYNAKALKPEAKVNFTLGNCYISLKNYDLAIEYYEKSYKEVSRYLIYDNMGYAYLGKGEYNNALDYFRKAVNEDSRQFDPVLGMAITHYYLGNYDMAKEYYLRAEKIEYQLKYGMEGLDYLTDNEGVFYGDTEIFALNEICKMLYYNYNEY